MNKFTHLLRFVQYLFDEKDTARKVKTIIEGLLKVRSPLSFSMSDLMSEVQIDSCKDIQKNVLYKWRAMQK